MPIPAVRIRSRQRSATTPGPTRAQTRAAAAAISSSTYTPASETAIRGHFPANRHAAVTSVYGRGMNSRNSTPALPVRAPNRRQAKPCPSSCTTRRPAQLTASHAHSCGPKAAGENPANRPHPAASSYPPAQHRRAPEQHPDRPEQPARQRPEEFQQPIRVEQRDRHRDRVQQPQRGGPVLLLGLRDHPGGAVGAGRAGQTALHEPAADVGGLALVQRVRPEVRRLRQRLAHGRAAVQPGQERVLRRPDPVERPGGLVLDDVEPLPARRPRREPQARPQLRPQFEELRRFGERGVRRRVSRIGMGVGLHHPSHPRSFSTGR